MNVDDFFRNRMASGLTETGFDEVSITKAEYVSIQQAAAIDAGDCSTSSPWPHFKPRWCWIQCGRKTTGSLPEKLRSTKSSENYWITPSNTN